jgi:hypothetical protein
MRFAKEGCRYSSTFLHPRLERHRAKAPKLWRRLKVNDKVSQPYPGVSCRSQPGRYAFTFVGGAEAGVGEMQVEEERMEELEVEKAVRVRRHAEEASEDLTTGVKVGLAEEEKWRMTNELGALGREYVGEDFEMESADESEAEDELDCLDREDLLAWMCRTSSECQPSSLVC